MILSSEQAENNCPTSITRQNPSVFHQPSRFSCALPHLTLKFQGQVNSTLLHRSMHCLTMHAFKRNSVCIH
jgi:hypothetical protein